MIIKIKLIWFTVLLLLCCSVARAKTEDLRDPFAPPATATHTPIHHHTYLPLKTVLVPIRYADASQVAQFLLNPRSHVISPGGYVATDVRTNQLWIREKQNHLKLILHMIRSLDVPIAQVLIKARIVSVDNDFLRSLGLLFGTETSGSTSDAKNQFTMDMPTDTVNTGSINIPIIKFSNGHLLDLTLTALEREGHVALIASPELMTNNRQAALIESGEEVPYQEKTGQGNTSVAFKKATLRLQVTPTVLPGNRILLQLVVNQDKISQLLVNGVPAINTQQLNTTVLLKDRETAVLGGIYEEMHQNTETGIPGLRQVPVMGGLFRQRQRLTERRQLLIFVTPRTITYHHKNDTT